MLSDMVRGVVDREVRRQIESTERMLREDLTLIGIDVEHLLAAERMPDRITIAQQGGADGTYVYRGLILDDDLVIDHCWQLPFEDPVIRRRLIGFVYAGREEERLAFARRHSLDQRVVLRADPDRLRGIRTRLIYVSSGAEFSLRDRDKHVQSQRLVEHLNRTNGWAEVNPYGD